MGKDNWKHWALLVITAFGLLQVIVFTELGIGENISTSCCLGRPMLAVIEEMKKSSPVLKPWPTLSSFQPWTAVPDLAPFSCEGFFGNGFVEEHRLLDDDCNAGVAKGNSSLSREAPGFCGSFRCLYSETLRTSICEGKHLVINPEKVEVSRGGEAIGEVLGRDEDEELPEYMDGAFQVQISGDWHEKMRPSAPVFDNVSIERLMPMGRINNHRLRSVLLNLHTADSRSVVCSHRVSEPTVIVTRFEYANLFHTSTDWFSAYISSRIFGLQDRPHILFLDGHCESPMDDGWKAMFTSVSYAKHFSGAVCFDHAIFAPLGYDVTLFKHIDSTLGCQGVASGNTEANGDTDKKTSRLREFGEFFAKSFETLPEEGAAHEGTIPQEINVLFVRRENYMAHPRHNGRPESRLANEEEVYEALKKWAKQNSDTSFSVVIVNGLLAHMTLDAQIQAVKKADVLVGAHGAGMTHLVFANPSTVVFEISSPLYRRPHFATMSYWMGMDYRVLYMDTSFANTHEVLTEMDGILEDVRQRKYL